MGARASARRRCGSTAGSPGPARAGILADSRMHSVRRTGCLAAVTLALFALAPACEREGATEVQAEVTQVPEPPIVVEPPPLEVEFAGCAGGEKQANTCMLGEDRALSLWVKGEPATVFVDATVVTATVTEAIDGGWRSTVRIPAGGKELRVERGMAKPWTLGLVERPKTPILDRIKKALPEQNDPKRTPGAEAGLKAIEAELGKMNAFERAEALRLATVLTWDVGRDGSGYGRRALAAALEYGDARMILDRASILGFMVEEGGADARWITDLETLYVENVASGDGVVTWLLDIGYYAAASGETGRGLDSLRRGEAMARRLGLRDEERSALARLAIELGSYGLEAERAAVLERFLSRNAAVDAESACLVAVTSANVATSLVYGKMTSDGGLDPEPMLRRTLARFESDPVRCEPGENAEWLGAHAFTHANFVLAAVLAGRWDDVEQRLQWFEGRTLGDVGEVVPSVALSRAQLALARGDVAAARRHLPRSGKHGSLVAWRRAMVAGHVEEAAGDHAAALAAFLAAERVVEQMLTSVGVAEARSGGALGLSSGAAHAIRILAADGRPDEASLVARRSRVRALRPAGRVAQLASLSGTQRRAWTQAISEYEAARDQLAANLTRAWLVAADERASMMREEAALQDRMRTAYARAFDVLAKGVPAETRQRPPAEGTLRLIFHPGVEGWYGIASTDGADVVRPIALPGNEASSDAVAEALLEPFAKEIEAAASIAILPMGPLLEVSFHELPWRGAPLVAHVPISWSADFDGGRPEASRGERALIVGDPASRIEGIGRLPRARAEADAATEVLESRGFAVHALLGEDATVAAVLDGLRGAGWFHYAGHGLATSSDPWDSALPLAGEALLTARDILALPEVPNTVVLSGCETAATKSGEALSLATTFVLAGASTVVGSTTDLADDEAADMASTLYRHASAGEGAAWFRAAVLDGRARGRPWTSGLRIWSP